MSFEAFENTQSAPTRHTTLDTETVRHTELLYDLADTPCVTVRLPLRSARAAGKAGWALAGVSGVSVRVQCAGCVLSCVRGG